MEIHPSTSSILHKLQSIWKKKKKKMKKNNKKSNNSTTSNSTSLTSPTETQSELERVFKIIDTNGDGKISSAELTHLMLSLGHHQDSAAVSKEAQGLIQELDMDGDGFVDLEEFMQAVGGGDIEDLREAFLVFDEDRNGFISAEELRRVMVGLGLGKCSLRECRGMIRRFDRNGDGMVDFEEFRSLMSINPSTWN